jgi:hypothetical protein
VDEPVDHGGGSLAVLEERAGQRPASVCWT